MADDISAYLPKSTLGDKQAMKILSASDPEIMSGSDSNSNSEFDIYDNKSAVKLQQKPSKDTKKVDQILKQADKRKVP